MKKINSWFKELYIATKIEFESRIFMSWKRIIKFVGILLVPILYGVTCVLAFWNPIEQMGNAPIAIMNQDHNVVLVSTFEDKDLKFGTLLEDGKELGSNGETKEDLEDYVYSLDKSTALTLTNGITITTPSETTFKVTSSWEIIKQKLLPKTDVNVSDENYVFQSPMIEDKMALTNITYISNENKINDTWKTIDYYAQMKIKDNYLSNLINYSGLVVLDKKDNEVLENNKKELFEKIQGNNIDIWSSYEQNFMLGYLMDILISFSDGLILKSIPSMITSFASGLILDDLSVSGHVLNLALNNGTIPFIANQNYVLLSSKHLKDDQKEALSKYTVFDNANHGSMSDGILISKLTSLKSKIDNGLWDIVERILGKNMTDILRTIWGWIDNGDQEFQTNIRSANDRLYNALTDKELNRSFDLNGLLNNINTFHKSDDIYFDYEFVNAANAVVANNSEQLFGAKTFSELPIVIFNQMGVNLLGNLTHDNLLQIEIEGKEFGLYGIGLGIFFLVIGLWIGILMHTFVFDRAKRYSKATAKQYYLSKTLLMLFTGLLQATLLTIAVYVAGWHILGITTILYMWLWFMASAVMFVFIIQGLWFVVKDETVGKFLAIIVMVFSLAAGGGTFPAFAQLPFFDFIGMFVPFTYVIQGFTAIVYGSGTMDTNLYIFQNFGVFFIYIALFFSLGFFIGAKNRNRDMNYGWHTGKKVESAMKALKRDTSHFRVRIETKHKVKYKYDWKALPNTFDQELYMKVREMYPFEGEFKWQKKKKKDFVQKPNFSDEDQISRNE